ncbi:MAG: N-acetyl sugar amidotransferase [Nitrospirae bacterium]|nr:N-acetyl sugar amidotransferase [Nitrospirota bacterium]
MDKQLLIQPIEVKYCKLCVVSNQRPRIVFDDEGICSACRFANEKQNIINWQAREKELEQLLEKHRSRDDRWDVVVPCSGGKDSSYVAHQLKYKYGMNPLTVTWAPFKYTDIGWKNYQNFIGSGFNNILCHPNGKFHRQLARLAFEELGDAWQPFTYGQMCFAFHIALRFNIKIIFFGENGEAEYGGDPKNNYKSHMPLEDWAFLYFKGATVDNLVQYGLKNKEYLKEEHYTNADIMFYRPPSIEELKRAGIDMHWYSYYHKWIPQENYYYSVENTGFQANPERSEGTYSKYASLDDRLDGFHYYLAFIKFGIGRATSDAAHEIRDGHITREEGVALVKRFDGEFPKKYHAEFLDYLGISEEYFYEVVDFWRPDHIWEKVNGHWRLKHQVE